MRAVPERRAVPPSPGRRTLQVSSATARILRSGHPWVVRDGDTGDLGSFQPGDLADLVDSRGDFVATAVVDPLQPVCARVVSHRPGSRLDDAAWGRRTERALERRRKLLDSSNTNAFRLIHAEADGLPGLHIDLWGDVVVATRTSCAAARFTEQVYEQIRSELGPLPLYERDHFEDLRSRRPAPRDAELPGRWLGESSSVQRWSVLEGGLRFEVEPLGGLTTGLYPDQRENRAALLDLLAAHDSHGVVANLFAHTGAFSVACAAGGARQVVSVDLSPRYCEWTRRNLVLNHIDPVEHPVVAADSLTWLREAPELAGAILDPPSYARGRSKGVDWNARRDYRALVTEVARRLQPGGWLLCCVNSKGLKRGWLARELEAGLRAAGRRLRESRVAPPASDHPRLKGFPEGLSFNGLLAWTEE